MKPRRNKKRCRKIVYQGREAARRALKELRHTGSVRFYKCPYCGKGIYHLTSETK